jgi:uncharacterized phage protein (TIGR02218 family)
MKTASNEVIDALLNYADVKFAEIYDFVLSNNNTYCYTSQDTNILHDGNTYLCDELFIKRGGLRLAMGLEVDDLELSIYPSNNANIGGTGWLAAVRNGALDAANVTLRRVFFKWWNRDAIIGGIKMFSGFVSDIDPLGRSAAILRVKSLVELLSVQWPFMTYESQCVWRLYFNGCGANRTALTSNGTVSAGGNTRTFPTSMNQANNYFDMGVIRFTSGNNIDSSRTIKSYSAGNVTLIYPLLNEPQANDAFQIYPGCNRTRTACNDVFNNSNNFRGFPYIPSPEAAI